MKIFLPPGLQGHDAGFFVKLRVALDSNGVFAWGNRVAGTVFGGSGSSLFAAGSILDEPLQSHSEVLEASAFWAPTIFEI